MYKINVITEVRQDLKILTDEILYEVLDYFNKYKTDPYKYSKPLYNQGGLDLQGYRKTYVAKATYRVVLKVEDGIAEIVEVVAVGKRENRQVYKEASNRINK